MKRCPSCNRTYTDVSLNFCLEDGTPLVSDAPAFDPNATIRYSPERDTADTEEPPPTEIYVPDSPSLNQTRSQSQALPWSAPPQTKKSNAIWWILGAGAVIATVCVGLLVMLILLASMSSRVPENANSNVRAVNRNTSYANANTANANSNAASTKGVTDDFSQQKWGTSNGKYGVIWYADGEYHMRSKKDTYLVMYAPNDDYNTANAIVKVTARSVDGTVPSAGFGLIVHGEQSQSNGLRDYALLIYPSEQPEYEIIQHKDGNQLPLVARTPSQAIHSGSKPNQLEVRVKGADLSFYVNGQYLTRINDSSNLRNGLAGFYTSDTTEVAFDDLQIRR